MFCTKCGAELQEGAKFCGNCGAVLDSKVKINNENSGNVADVAPIDNSGKGKSAETGGKKKRGGFFSTQMLTCQRCGKTFESRKVVDFCPECAIFLDRREEEADGYLIVAMDAYEEPHTGDEKFFDEVLAHRDALLKKYKLPAEFPKTGTELQEKLRNYQTLSQQETRFIMSTIMEYSFQNLGMDAMSGHLILPGVYTGTVVDVEDIFSVSFFQLGYDRKNSSEIVMYLFLSNDPYLPAFPVVTSFEISSLQMKSWRGRAAYEELFTSLCPNLTYPIMKMRELKRTIADEGEVHGNMSPDLATHCITTALDGVGAYSMCYRMAKTLEGLDILPEETEELIKHYRLLSYDVIVGILDKEKKKTRKFWEGLYDELYAENLINRV